MWFPPGGIVQPVCRYAISAPCLVHSTFPSIFRQHWTLALLFNARMAEKRISAVSIWGTILCILHRKIKCSWPMLHWKRRSVMRNEPRLLSSLDRLPVMTADGLPTGSPSFVARAEKLARIIKGRGGRGAGGERTLSPLLPPSLFDLLQFLARAAVQTERRTCGQARHFLVTRTFIPFPICLHAIYPKVKRLGSMVKAVGSKTIANIARSGPDAQVSSLTGHWGLVTRQSGDWEWVIWWFLVERHE